MDPRVRTPADGLAKQFELSMQCYESMLQGSETLVQIQKLRSQIKQARTKANGDLATDLAELDKAAGALAGTPRVGGRGGPPVGREQTISGVSQQMAQLLRLLQGADVTPTATAVTACAEVAKVYRDLQARWARLLEKDVKSINERLSKADLPVLAVK
jgi:hypothetical protein